MVEELEGIDNNFMEILFHLNMIKINTFLEKGV